MPCSPAPARIAVVGGGKMGQAILAGWLGSSDAACQGLEPASFEVANPGQQRRDQIQRDFGVACVADVSQLQPADLCIVAVKPQVIDGVLEGLAALPWISQALVVSIAAGISTQRIAHVLGTGVRVVRVMPNTALAVGCGTSVLCAGKAASPEDLQLAQDLFSAIGYACVLPEEAFDAATAISGSGPAYVAALVEAMAQEGAATGLDAQTAEALAAHTVLGTGALLCEPGHTATQTRLDVCSPGGTTLAALDAMESAGYSASIAAGVAAAIQRSKELGA